MTSAPTMPDPSQLLRFRLHGRVRRGQQPGHERGRDGRRHSVATR
jgi:hypothetical protein